MTSAVDTIPMPELSPYASAPLGVPPEDDLAVSMPEEINARRARVENPELLQRLRGL